MTMFEMSWPAPLHQSTTSIILRNRCILILLPCTCLVNEHAIAPFQHSNSVLQLLAISEGRTCLERFAHADFSTHLKNKKTKHNFMACKYELIIRKAFFIQKHLYVKTWRSLPPPKESNYLLIWNATHKKNWGNLFLCSGQLVSLLILRIKHKLLWSLKELRLHDFGKIAFFAL